MNIQSKTTCVSSGTWYIWYANELIRGCYIHKPTSILLDDVYKCKYNMELIAIIIIWSFHDVTHGPACIAFQCSHLYITSNISIRAMEGYTCSHMVKILYYTTGILLHLHEILCIIIITMKRSLTVNCGSCTN